MDDGLPHVPEQARSWLSVAQSLTPCSFRFFVIDLNSFGSFGYNSLLLLHELETCENPNEKRQNVPLYRRLDWFGYPLVSIWGATWLLRLDRLR